MKPYDNQVCPIRKKKISEGQRFPKPKKDKCAISFEARDLFQFILTRGRGEEGGGRRVTKN